MRAESFTFAAAALLFSAVSAMTPAGVFPVNTENMTNFFDTTMLAVNGANIPKANTTKAPTIALDKNLNGTTFAVIMFDPDTAATGVGGNGTNSFMHWFQGGLTSSATSTKVAGKTVFTLVNAKNTTAVNAYIQPGPPAGETHRYTQILIATTGLKAFNVSRNSFDAAAFVKQANVTVVSSNFFNVTGV